MTGTALAQARDALARQAWADAFEAFSRAAATDDLSAADHERFALAAYLVGEDDQCAAAWESAYRVSLEHDDAEGAARCAFWLAFSLMMRGQMSQAGGWLARANRLIEEQELDCAARGYLCIPALLGALDSGDAVGAHDLALEATEIAARFDDADLRAFGTLGHGQALIAMGERAAGMARLDEVMVSVTAAEVGPITSGIVYCAVIIECMQLFDLPRASEWTDALSSWCDAQPDLVPYRGQCLVHRSQLQQAAGHWPDAITTAEAACRTLTDPPHPALGLAYYQEAELHRLVGSFDDAQTAYRRASRNGHHPMPGLALLQLARGDVPAAAATITWALQEASNSVERPALLAAAAEIFRVAGDVAATRSAADELTAIAAGSSSEVLTAMAAQASGAALVTEGEPAAALVELRTAASTWQSLHMPYEAGRAASLRGLACAALGDRTSAALEFDNAKEIFTELGAQPELERLTALASGLTDPPDPQPATASRMLSAREREVLAEVAAGKTNREIAESLVISQHTVGRHVENIFTKLGVTSRAAATAYAYEHQIL